MGKIAFVFSGQGDQHPGMGAELYEQYPAAARVFELCDSIRPGTKHTCFSGTAEELMETRNTQPCLFAMELAAAAVLRQLGVQPEAEAGFSLGEVAAATDSGFFSLEDGFRLVCRRGELMQREADRCDASMAAVVKLPAETVQELCQKIENVYPVNFNCPGQVTVSGLSAQMPALTAAVKAAGGRAIPLQVKGGFHSPFMAQAARDFEQELRKANIGAGAVPLYANRTGRPYTDDVVGLLSEQICSPVRWEETIRNMIADSADDFIEIGPGRTLTNMIKKIDPVVKARTVFEYLEDRKSC